MNAIQPTPTKLTNSLITTGFFVATMFHVVAQLPDPTPPPYAAIYVFGHSLADTKNCNWDPKLYWRNRASNGPLWPELLSTNLGLPYSSSRNYAVCGSTTADVLAQIANLRAPTNASESLFCLASGAGANFLFSAGAGFSPNIHPTNQVAWDRAIRAWIQNDSNGVRRLYAKGARSIMVLNCPDVNQIPFFISQFGTNESLRVQLRERIIAFNAGLNEALKAIDAATPDLRLFPVDFFSRFDDLFHNYAANGFSNADRGALDDPSLADKSFTGPGQNYLHWDSVHLTTKTAAFVANWMASVVTNLALERLDASIADGSFIVGAKKLKIGRVYTVQRSRDLRNWEDINNFTAAAGTNEWRSLPNNDSGAFFRLRWER